MSNHELYLDIDDRKVRGVMISLATALEKSAGQNKVRTQAARQIRLALEGGALDTGSLLPHIASGDSDAIADISERLHLDFGLLRTVASHALSPFLRHIQRQLAPLATDFQWEKGHCFICGSPASMAELQGNNQVRHVRCGSCGADWTCRRLHCIYCGNEDYHTLGVLYAGDQKDTVRIEVCDTCHGYVKVIAAYTPTPDEMLPIEDLATLHLDYIARERGYSRSAVQ